VVGVLEPGCAGWGSCGRGGEGVGVGDAA
jgi:hypothetical protein